MAKQNRKATYPQPPKSPANYIAAILKGVVVSIIISVICALFLSLLVLISDNRHLEEYLDHIMIGVALASVFLGSLYAAKKVASRGLLVGIGIGIIYALFSVGVSSELGQNQILLPMLANKLAAASLAGALGGFVGINLQ